MAVLANARAGLCDNKEINRETGAIAFEREALRGLSLPEKAQFMRQACLPGRSSLILYLHFHDVLSSCSLDSMIHHGGPANSAACSIARVDYLLRLESRVLRYRERYF
jgi:hypothetical protein